MPSLSQCYKWNLRDAAKAGHDAHIKSQYNALLSDTCVRNYPDLEFLYCLGCNNLQMKYVDVAEKKCNLCLQKILRSSYGTQTTTSVA